MPNQESTLIDAAQAATPEDIQHDLHDARALLEQSGNKEESKKYRKAAEIILLKVVRLDPRNEEAKVLLQNARAVPVLPASHPMPAKREDIPFTAVPMFAKKQEKRTRPKLPLALVVVVV